MAKKNDWLSWHSRFKINFLLIAIGRTVFAEQKKKGRSTKISRVFLIFTLGLSYDIKNLVMILPRFSTLKDHN